MDLASVVAALASVGVRVSGSNPNNNIQGDSSRACPTGLAGPEPSGTHNDPGQHFHVGEAWNRMTTSVSWPLPRLTAYVGAGTGGLRRVVLEPCTAPHPRGYRFRLGRVRLKGPWVTTGQPYSGLGNGDQGPHPKKCG